jgi:hypothetical protein
MGSNWTFQTHLVPGSPAFHLSHARLIHDKTSQFYHQFIVIWPQSRLVYVIKAAQGLYVFILAAAWDIGFTFGRWVKKGVINILLE